MPDFNVALSETALQIIENSTRGVIVTDRPEPVLVTVTMIQGQLGRWAVVQHPFKRPEGLFHLVGVIGDAARSWSEGISSLPMKTFSTLWEIEAWLRAVFERDPAAAAILAQWNTPRSCLRGDASVSSVHHLPQDDDFIDIDALLRNVARDAYREAKDV